MKGIGKRKKKEEEEKASSTRLDFNTQPPEEIKLEAPFEAFIGRSMLESKSFEVLEFQTKQRPTETGKGGRAGGKNYGRWKILASAALRNPIESHPRIFARIQKGE